MYKLKSMEIFEFCNTLIPFIDYRVAKCDVTKIKIYELIRFVETILEIKTKYVSLLKIRMLVQNVS